MALPRGFPPGSNIHIFFYLGLCGLLSITSVSGHEGSATFKYDSASFEENISKSRHFVMFFAPWCGHCKRLSPTWEELAEKYNRETENQQEVTIAKVDCTVETSLCSDQDITGYPTLKFFTPGDEISVRYRGSRELDALQQFIKDQLSGPTTTPKPDDEVEVPKPDNGLIELTEDTFHKFVEHGYHFVKFYAPWCGHCQKLAPVWDSLAESLQYDSSVSVAKVDCTVHRTICQEFEVKGYPTLIWIQDGKKVEKYQGSRSHEDLKSFVSKMKKQARGDSVVLEDGKVPEKEMTMVVHLTADNFENGVASGTTFVKFYAPWCGHCKRLAPTWDELAKKFIGDTSVKIAKVDCTVEGNQQLCKDNEVEGYPTLLLFKNGKRQEEYRQSRDLSALHLFVMSHSSRDEL